MSLGGRLIGAERLAPMVVQVPEQETETKPLVTIRPAQRLSSDADDAAEAHRFAEAAAAMAAIRVAESEAERRGCEAAEAAARASAAAAESELREVLQTLAFLRAEGEDTAALQPRADALQADLTALQARAEAASAARPAPPRRAPPPRQATTRG